MSNSSDAISGADRAKIDALRAAWIEAVEDANIDRLAALVTDDFAGVRDTGRCISGKEEMRRDFRQAFEKFDAEPQVLSSEAIVRGKWAIDTVELETARTPVGSLVSTKVHVIFVVVLRLQPDASWKIARLIQLLD